MQKLPHQANQSPTFQECHPKASLPLTPGLFLTPDFIPLVCGAPARLHCPAGPLSPGSWHLPWLPPREGHRESAVGPGLELLPLSSTPATPRSPKLRTPEPAVLGMQNGLTATHDILMLPWHPTPVGRSPEGREPGPASWPCDLGRAGGGLWVAHCRPL